MKKSILLFAFLLTLLVDGKADCGDWFMNLNTGYQYQHTYQTSLSFEKELCYQNAFEIYFDFSNHWDKCDLCGKYCVHSKKNTFQSYMVGLAYKLPIYRGEMYLFRLRSGMDAGIQSKKAVGGFDFGLEYDHYFSNGMAITIQQKNDFIYSDKFKVYSGVIIGLKIPLYR